MYNYACVLLLLFSEPESFDGMWASWAPWAPWNADTSTRGEGVQSRDRTVRERYNGKESHRGRNPTLPKPREILFVQCYCLLEERAQMSCFAAP